MVSRFVPLLLSTFVVVFGMFSAAQAQENSGPTQNRVTYSVGAIPQYGFIISHRSVMREVIKGHANAATLYLERAGSNQKDWEKLYGNPKTGLSFWIADLGNPEQLGTAMSLSPFVRFHFVDRKKFSLDLKIDIGLGYIQKPFDRIENHKNMAIGSRFNGFLALGAFPQYAFGKFKVNGLLAFNHFSNGGFRSPNLGINIVTAGLGASYQLGSKMLDEHAKISNGLALPEWHFNTMAAIGFIGGGPAKKEIFPAYVLSFEGVKTVSEKFAFSLAPELFYRTIIKERLIQRNEESEPIAVNTIDMTELGLFLRWHIHVSRVNLHIGMGGYAFSKHYQDGIFYHRLASRYRINRWLSANVSLKTHWFKADFIEAGLVYHFIKK